MTIGNKESWVDRAATRVARVGWILCVCACSRPEVIDVVAPAVDAPVVEVSAASLEGLRPIVIVRTEQFDDATTNLEHVTGLVVVGDTVVVVDQGADEIVFLEHSRGVVRKVGGSGDGPGELRRPTHIAWSGDSLFVIDQHGLNVFAPDGSFVHRAVIDATRAGATRNMTPYPQSLVFDGQRLVTSFPVVREMGNVRRLHPLSSNGVVGEPIVQVSPEYWYKLDKGMEGPPLLSGRLDHSTGTDGVIYVSRQDGQSIDAIASDGRLTRRILIDVPRQRVSKAALDSVFGVAGRAFQDIQHDDPTQQQKRLRAFQNQPRAKYRAVVGQVLAGAPGLLLVKRADLSPIDPASPAPATWDLTDADGHAIGRLLLPGRFRPMYLTANSVAGVVLDENDVPAVARYVW